MVKMRLFRMGDKKNPIYRVVVVDSRKAATGEYIDCVGHYNPHTSPVELTIDNDKGKKMISIERFDALHPSFYRLFKKRYEK